MAIAVVGLLLWANAAAATQDPNPDDKADIVYLRDDCGSAPENRNCFESMEYLSSLTDPDGAGPLTEGWIWDIRKPQADDGLLVDVGPSTFGPFTCASLDSAGEPLAPNELRGHVSIRGAGPTVSILKGFDGVETTRCDHLNFIDIGIHGDRHGAWIHGQGMTTWSNVDLFAVGANLTSEGWHDDCAAGDTERGLHYFHGSRVRATDPNDHSYVYGYAATCAETWFFGGEIDVTVKGETDEAVGVFMQQIGDFRAFGTLIRGRVLAGGSVGSGEMIGAKVDLENFEAEIPEPKPWTTTVKGMFHSHGVAIDLSVDAGVSSDIDVIALDVGNAGPFGRDSFAHTPGTVFHLTPSTNGTPTRVRVFPDSTSLSSFLWPAGPLPPTSSTESNRLLSQDGADMWVETDCNAAGDCDSATNGGALETHMMIYSSTDCGSTNPWFDMVTGTCRQ